MTQMTIQVSDQYELEFQFSQDQVNQFIALTGDDNPLHHDVEYAANTVFKKPIMHGFLSATIFSTILGSHFPGKGTVYVSQTLSFLRPMFVDTPYKGFVKVIAVNEEKKQCTLKTHVLNDRGKIMIKGEATVIF